MGSPGIRPDIDCSFKSIKKKSNEILHFLQPKKICISHGHVFVMQADRVPYLTSGGYFMIHMMYSYIDAVSLDRTQ